jgi:hypothetical protein
MTKHVAVEQRQTAEAMNQQLAEDLAALGYPGYAYLRTNIPEKTPEEVLLIAIARDDLEPRLIEALPWVILEYWDRDFIHLIARAKWLGLQSRLGFLVNLACRISQMGAHEVRSEVLSGLESTIDKIKLSTQDVLMRRPCNAVELHWLEQNRSEQAKHWNVITGLRPEHLEYSTTSAE